MLLLNNRALHARAFDEIDDGFGGGGGGGFGFSGGGGGGVSLAPAPTVGSNSPTQRFDVSVLDALRPSDKYLGRNRVSDVREAYQTYIGGAPVGRGGQYAVDAARRFGTTITEAARGYLVSAGLPTLADDTSTQTTTTVTQTDLKTFQDEIKKQIEDLKGTDNKNLVETLVDVIPQLFGNAAAREPLQSQAYGYTPVSGDFGEAGGGAGGIGIWLLLGGAAIVAYLIYKHYSG